MTATTFRRQYGSGHSYTLDGVPKIKGVTTMMKGLGGPPESYFTKFTAGHAVDNWDRLAELPPSARLEEIAGATKARFSAAAVRGTAVHKLAERLSKGEEVDVPDHLRGHIESCIGFLDGYQVEPFATEVALFSRRHKYAGSADFFATAVKPGGQVVRVLGDFKGLALDTPIPTPDGWSTIGALSAGDQVFDSAGQPCTVTAKSSVHYRRCYRIRFDDASSVVCDDEHLWLTTSGRNSGRRTTITAVHTTEEIRQTLTLYGQHHHRVAVAGPLSLPETGLPIHPYVLGCWLGDGTASCGRITNPEPEIFERIAACGYEIGGSPPSARCPQRSIYGLATQLRKAGLLGHKAVPGTYLRASRSQRLALLRGLMDTDGTWNTTRSQAVFTSADKALALSVRELALSLGQRAVLHTITAHGFGLTIEAYHVSFTPVGLNPFALSRKADKVSVRSEVRSSRRVITAVEETLTVPTQCITVDSPDSTYLCTEAMIPTHNTTASGPWGSVAFQLAGYRYADFMLSGDGGKDSEELPVPEVDECWAVWLRADGWDVYPLHVTPEVHRQLLYIDQCRIADEECRQYKGDALPHPDTVRRVRLADADDSPDPAAED